MDINSPTVERCMRCNKPVLECKCAGRKSATEWIHPEDEIADIKDEIADIKARLDKLEAKVNG